ncbi:hypothetical protein PSHT_07824 [Puccinia striiformis]|uniref:CxC1-like cysteine cluster associated with KDZ transposases domain-containing protein n=1 Tax=Puccinia striiformis TaxID=27350 RepID=A0A2S4VUZ5_9BASI|nr:hypothetical protein PSHT_07824 [Puccinia striiformis]
MAPRNDLYQFHYGSQLPVTESHSQRVIRLASEKRTAAEIGATLRRATARIRKRQNRGYQEDAREASDGHQPDYVNDELGFNNNSSLWEDTEHIMSQQRRLFTFCPCTPDPVRLLANGYLASTPVFPQTAFSLRLLNFYDLLWNICNSHITSFAKVLQRWNETMSMRLCVKNSSTKPRELRRNLSASIDAYRKLKSMQQTLVRTVTSITKQDELAQQSCPACFGVVLPANHSMHQPDNHKIYICLDANFQQRHHERSSKNYIKIESQPLFIPPEDIQESNTEIRDAEIAKKVSQKAKDRCTEQHKAADDRRNASSWKGCDDTGLFGCCCRHDSVISFCNIFKTGEGRGLPMSIIKRLFADINPDVNVGVLYDIGCTLGKFLQKRDLLTDLRPRMTFATAVFHSYVHDWPCQLQFNPRYNDGWGLTDGEGLERLWSYLSPLVSPLRYATRNHRISAINHQSMFHNTLGIENIVHAVTTKIESQKKVDALLQVHNPHSSDQYFTVDFFCAQWSKQRSFEIDQNEKDRVQKEEQAQFFERGESMKNMAEAFVAKLARSSTHSDPAHALSILQQLRDMQKEQDEEAEKLGSFFSVSAGAERDREQERRLALLWSAKSALYKSAVQIQGETQPLRDSKSHGHRLGTILKEKIFEALDRRKKPVARLLKLFCDRRADYLQHHARDQLSRPENQAISYDEFKKLQLDDPFWNDGYLCLSKDPWAVDPTVRTGIHAVLRLDRATEELVQLSNELRRCLSWGVAYHNQLKLRIDQCVFDTADDKLNAALDSFLGTVSYATRTILSDELQSVQLEHDKLLASWQPVVEEIITLGVVPRSALPIEWLVLVEFLNRHPPNQSTEADLNLLLEEIVLEDQDDDGESIVDDADISGGAEYVPPEDDEQLESNVP